MAAKKRRKKKKNSSAAYLGFLIVLAIGIVILLVLMAGIGSCRGSKDNGEGLDTGTVSDASASGSVPISSGSNSSSTESTEKKPTAGKKISGSLKGLLNIPPALTAPAETKPVSGVPKIPYNAEEDWALYVIGKNNPLPDDFTITEKVVVGERTLDERCADYAIKMLNDAAEQGVDLFVTSSYRSVQRQAENMQSYINTLIGRGYSEEEAKIQAEKEIAIPGCSEHNAGLAMDIVSSDYWSDHSDLDESFEQLPHFNWLIANSWKYGFVLSYPKDKEEITGIIYEPWHYRFVGLKHAENIHKVYEETGEFLTVNEYMERYIDMGQ